MKRMRFVKCVAHNFVKVLHQLLNTKKLKYKYIIYKWFLKEEILVQMQHQLVKWEVVVQEGGSTEQVVEERDLVILERGDIIVNKLLFYGSIKTFCIKKL